MPLIQFLLFDFNTLSSFQLFFYKAVLFFLVVHILYVLVFKSTGKSKLIYLVIIALLTFLIKLPYFSLGELNPDESEWITIVQIWKVNFSPYINSDPHTSGIVALLPLYLLDIFISLNYSSIRILGTVFDLLTIYLTYRILQSHLKQNKMLLFLALAVLYCMLNLSIESDFIAYNTEHLCILIFTALVYILNEMGIFLNPDMANERKRHFVSLLMFAGLLFGASLFIKIQNVPAFFILFCFVSFHFLKNKNYKHFVYLILISLLPVIIILLSLYLNGSFYDFYVRYVLTNLDYASKGLNFDFIDSLVYEPYRFKLKSLYPFSLIICLAFFLIITNLKKQKKSLLNQNFYYFLLVLVVTIYEIIQPKNYFQHYFLLLYQPLIFLFICFKNLEVRKSILVITFACQFLFFWIFKIKDKSLVLNDSKTEKLFYSKITKDIQSKTEITNCDTKNILVWGWNSPYYVYGNFIPVTQDFVNVHLFTHKGYLEDYYLSSFISDLQRNKHKKILVIDDLQKRKKWKLYRFSEFIHHYNLSKYFKRLTMIEHNEKYDTYVIEVFEKGENSIASN